MRLRVLVAGLVALVLSAAGAAPAWAHASLVSSTPEDGAKLAELPSRVTFTFSEDISEPAYVVVRTGDGTSVTSGEPVVDGATVTQDLDGSAASGDLTMAYRVVSVDGHPVTGELGFTVTGKRGDAKGGGAAADPPRETNGSAGTTDDPPETTADTTSTAAESRAGHWSDHAVHYLIGGGALAVALALVLSSRRRPE